MKSTEFILIILKFFSGNIIDVNSGEWLGQLSGLGAGIDSFFEYLLKVNSDQ